MRLHPSGEAGPIASQFAGFARYQRESAWTWEHMALTRARPVAGDAGLCKLISIAREAAPLRRCLGACDFARLGPDITTATARVRRWYDRVIEEPARRAAEEIGDS